MRGEERAFCTDLFFALVFCEHNNREETTVYYPRAEDLVQRYGLELLELIDASMTGEVRIPAIEKLVLAKWASQAGMTMVGAQLAHRARVDANQTKEEAEKLVKILGWLG